MLIGVNSECVDSRCDCIRNGAGACVASPPVTCDPEEEGTCPGELKCHPTYHWCTCIGGSLIGYSCVPNANVALSPTTSHHISYMSRKL